MVDLSFRNRRGSRVGLLALAALFVAVPAMAQPKGPGKTAKPPEAAPEPPPPPPPDPAAQAEQLAKEEARKHFDQGLALFDRGSLDAAYPEFEKSISIYPTRAAIKNAALCLRKLNRFAEAVDMNERLLAMPNVSEEEKGIANAELTQLRPVVGNIVIDGVQSGATVTIDGKPEGTTPLKGPLHVAVGTRVVRILKAGFETFEQRVEAPGGKEVTVRAVLAPLELSGWLLVEEASGYNVDVVLDGVVVGKTPWRGLIATGDHLVVLRGDKRQGTQPARVEVKQSQVTNMLVIAEELASDLKIKSELPGGEIRVDGVLVGRDSWEGPVRAGSHRVEIGGNGYAMAERRIDVAPGKTETLTFAPTVEAPRTFWEENPAFLEAGAAFVFGPGFGGIARNCDACTISPAMGGIGMVRGGIAVRNRWTVGFDLGFTYTQQTFENRTATIEAVGIDPYPAGCNDANGKTTNNCIDDDLRSRGVTAGIAVGVKFGDKFPVGLRLGVGGVFGTIADNRTASLISLGRRQAANPITYEGLPYEIERVQADGITAFYVMPEIRAGMRVKKNLDVLVSIGGLLTVNSKTFKWDPDAGTFQAGSDGLAKFADEDDTVASSTQFVGTAGLLMHYRF